jgi:hypothetical protein
MTEQRDLDRILDHWFTDGPTTASDRLFYEVVDRIERQPQRRAWRFLLRDLAMTTTFRIAFAATSIALVVAFGVLVFGGPGPRVATAVPTPSPSASSAGVSPSPTASAVQCDDPAFTCAGPLSAGTHSSTAFQPAITFTLPAGYSNSLDRARAYTLHPPGDVFFFQVVSEVDIPAQNADCSAEQKPGVGNTVDDWVQFLTKHPGLVASTPTPVSVGGFDGMSLSFHVRETWTARCPNSIGPAVMLVTDTANPPDRVYWIDDQYTTFNILDVAGTTVIVRLESGPSPAANTRDQATVEPIIASMRFSPSGPAASDAVPSGPSPSR